MRPLAPQSLLLLALAGCGPQEPAHETGLLGGSDGSADGGGSGGGEADPEVEPPSPSWTAEEALAAVDEALSTGFPNPVQAQEAYLRLMALGDVFCPGSETQITDTWLYGCKASSGVSYMGIAEYLALDAEQAAAEGLSTYEVVAGDFVITDVDGGELRVGGGMSWTRHLPEGGAELGPWEVEMGGSWLDQTRTDWLAEGASLMLFMGGTEADQGGELWVDGGAGVGPHDLFFEDLRFEPERCALPSGRVSVRGPDTWWYTLAYPDECGACGELLFQDGTVLGEACGDLSALYEAVTSLTEGRP